MGKTKTIWAEIEEKLKKELTENRYRHTMGVTYTACALAMVHGANLSQARMGGLLHDCAKCIPNSEKIEICKKKKIPVSEFEIEHPVLLHAKLGAYLAKKEYGCDDQAVLDAITWHTTGRPAMTLLEKIVFVSDYIEPNRDRSSLASESMPSSLLVEEEKECLRAKGVDFCVDGTIDETMRGFLPIRLGKAVSHLRKYQRKTGRSTSPKRK